MFITIVFLHILQFGQAFYGFFFSSEVALFGYLYAMIEEKQYYQKITGRVRASTLIGKFVSSSVSQIIALVIGSPPFNALVYMSIFGNYFFTTWQIINNWWYKCFFIKLHIELNNLKKYRYSTLGFSWNFKIYPSSKHPNKFKVFSE